MTGFKIENPNAPAVVQEISPTELKAKLDSGEIKELFDVRTPKERGICLIEEGRLLDADADTHITGLDRSIPIAFHCHHGGRSHTAAQRFIARGHRKVYNLAGGIEKWSLEVDPKVPRY